MQKRLEKGSDEWLFFQDYYKFEKLIQSADRLYKKYKNVPFSEYAKQLILAHINDVDRRARENIGKNE